MANLSTSDVLKDRVIALIIAKSSEYNIDKELLLRIAKCESNYNPYIKNSSSSAYGVFQFLTSTWESQLKKYNLDYSRDSLVGQIDLPARILRDGGISHWKESIECWQR